MVMLLASKTADPFCQPASDGGGALSEFPADDVFEPGGGRVRFPYSERLPVRGNWFRIVIEVFNQIARRNFILSSVHVALRARVLRTPSCV